MKLNKKLLNGIIGASIIGAFTIGGTFAYLTDYDHTVNEFTVGKIDIDLEEPGWVPEENKTIVPSQEIEKDPQITNTGKNDAYVYLEVSIPVKDVVTSDAQGNRRPSAPTELFKFTAKNNWSLMTKKKVGENQVYTYCYNEILAPETTTESLFDSITFANIIEGQLDKTVLNVPVRAYAIQTENTGGEGSIPEKAKKAFEKYVNPNQEQDGKVTA